MKQFFQLDLEGCNRKLFFGIILALVYSCAKKPVVSVVNMPPLVIREKETTSLAGNQKNLSPSFSPAYVSYQEAEREKEAFEKIHLRYPEEQLKKDLEEKSTCLIRAQTAYLRTIKQVQNNEEEKEFLLPSVYAIGHLYEKLHQELIGLDSPADLSEEQKKLYEKEWKKKLVVLLDTAISFYQSALQQVERLEGQEEWVRRIKESIQKLRQTMP